MKKWIIALSLTTLLSSSAILAHNAVTNNPSKNRAYWNPITLNNYAPYGILYRFYLDRLPNAIYFIDKNGTDIFHTGAGNKRSWFAVQACTKTDSNGKCIMSVRHFLPNPYNAEEIATINIKAVDDIEVICRDGSSTSCMLQ